MVLEHSAMRRHVPQRHFVPPFVPPFPQKAERPRPFPTWVFLKWLGYHRILVGAASLELATR